MYLGNFTAIDHMAERGVVVICISQTEHCFFGIVWDVAKQRQKAKRRQLCKRRPCYRHVYENGCPAGLRNQSITDELIQKDVFHSNKIR